MAERFITIECPGCDGARVRAQVTGTVASDPADIGIWQVVEMAQCPSCTGALVTVHAAEFGGEDYDGQTMYDRTALMRLWPDPPRHLQSLAPAPVLADLDEAKRCLSVGAFSATTVMCRRALEGMTEGHGPKKATLEQRLDAMSKADEIDPRLAEWARELRDIGNQGAHGGSKTSRADATDALALAEALADYLYTFRLRFDEFRTRRQQVAAKATEFG